MLWRPVRREVLDEALSFVQTWIIINWLHFDCQIVRARAVNWWSKTVTSLHNIQHRHTDTQHTHTHTHTHRPASIDRVQGIAILLVASPVIPLTRFATVVRPLAARAPLQRFLWRGRLAASAVPQRGAFTRHLSLGKLEEVAHLGLRRDAAAEARHTKRHYSRGLGGSFHEHRDVAAGLRVPVKRQHGPARKHRKGVVCLIFLMVHVSKVRRHTVRGGSECAAADRRFVP